MAAGYGGQLVALNLSTPTEERQASAMAGQQSAASTLANVTLPYKISQAKSETESAKMKTELDRIKTDRATQINDIDQTLMGQVGSEQTAEQPAATSQLAQVAEQPPAEGRIAAQPTTAGQTVEKKPTFTPEIDNAIKFFNSNPSQGAAEWDKRFTELGKTQPEAKQLVGRYGKMGNYGKAVAANEVAQVPAAVKSQLDKPAEQTSPLATASGMILSPYTGKPSAALTRRMILDPEGTTQILKAQAVGMYEKTRDPRYLQAYAPDILSTITNIDQVNNTERREQIKFNMGMTAMFAHDMIETGRAQGKDSEQTRRHYEANIDKMLEMKMITPERAAQLKAEKEINWTELGAAELHAMTVLEDMNFKDKQGERSEVYVGNTAENLPVYRDTKHGTESVGTVPVTSKVGAGSGRKSVWQLKYEAELALNGGDIAGAVREANSKAHMTQEDIEASALATATKRQEIATNAGDTNFDYDTFLNQTRAKLQAAAAAQNAATGTGDQGGGGAAAPAGGGLTKSGYTQAQAQRAWTNRKQQKGSIHDREGSIKRPWTPRNAEEFKKVNRTDWYIDGEGVLYYVDENGKHLRGGVR